MECFLKLDRVPSVLLGGKFHAHSVFVLFHLKALSVPSYLPWTLELCPGQQKKLYQCQEQKGMSIQVLY